MFPLSSPLRETERLANRALSYGTRPRIPN
jgi:hypothetical protein